MVYLIGVDHSIQHDGLPGIKSPPLKTLELIRQQFAKYLVDTALSVGADCIAEEFNKEAVEWSKATQSIAQNVAIKLGINHIFCDPDTGIRKELGIYKAAKEMASKKREEYWLNLLFKGNNEEIIFIVGACHVKSFNSLLRSKGFSTKVLNEYFKKEHYES
jgi:hypothetical protein